MRKNLLTFAIYAHASERYCYEARKIRVSVQEKSRSACELHTDWLISLGTVIR